MKPIKLKVIKGSDFLAGKTLHLCDSEINGVYLCSKYKLEIVDVYGEMISIEKNNQKMFYQLHFLCTSFDELMYIEAVEVLRK